MRIRPQALINPDMWATWNYVTGTDADTTMVTNSLYQVDMSAWATADRVYTLPASPNLNDLVGVEVITGNASFELLLKGNASQTVNGGSAASEWSRVFITGEAAFFRYVAANKWIVEADARIAQRCLLRLSTNATGETAATFTQPTAKSGVWTADIDNASLSTVSTDRFKTRRAGDFLIGGGGVSASNVTDANYFTIALYKNGTTTQFSTGQTVNGATQLGRADCPPRPYTLAVDDFVVFQWRSQEGAKGLVSTAAPNLATHFELIEVL